MFPTFELQWYQIHFRLGLSAITKVVKGIGAGFHQNIQGVRYVNKVSVQISVLLFVFQCRAIALKQHLVLTAMCLY